jgi:hypothetical protein
MPPDKYLVASVCPYCLFFQSIFSPPNPSCIQHTMRFTATWSTLKNTFIFSAIALLSLAPAANADTDIEFTAPLANERVGMNTVYTAKWYVPREEAERLIMIRPLTRKYCRHTVRGVYPELHGILGNLWLRNADESIPICACRSNWTMLRLEADIEHDRCISSACGPSE